MFKFLALTEETFGLDINDLVLKIVKLQKKGKGFDLVSFNKEKIEPGIMEDGVIRDEMALVKIIKSACKTVNGKKLKTKYVVASLPEGKSFLQVIQMPKMDPEELKLSVPLEAENYIPMPIEEVYLDFQVIPPIKDYFNYLEVLLVATPKKIVDSYVSCLKKAGLVPIAFEIESEAIARALVKKENNSSLLILIAFREDSTKFIVFSGSSIRFTSSIPISSQSLTKAISESLKIDFSEAEKLKKEYDLIGEKTSAKAEKVSKIIVPILEDLSVQIQKYLDFYNDHSSYEYLLSDGKTKKILICGEGAELKGIADFMSKKLGIAVELGDPLANCLLKKQKNILGEDVLSFVAAIGLALRQIKSN
jgi:type IV pilus assembly protein PilM